MKPLRSLTLMLAGLAMLGPFCIDTYLPSFAAIAREFGIAPVLVQQSLSAYLLCFAGMMLFHGTLSDSFGRRPVIIASLAVFILASAGAALAPDLGWLIVFRALQGLSAGAGTVVGRAMIRDRLADAHAQKMMSDVTVAFAVAPAAAPVLGGWLQLWFGWRSVFVFLAVFGLLMCVICWRSLPESLPACERHAFRPRRILRGYWSAIRHPHFLLLALALGFASIGFFVYIASAPRFVLEVLHLPVTAFGWLFVPLVTGMVAGAFIAGRLAHRWRPVRLIRLGYLLMAAAALINLAYNLLYAARVPWAVAPLFLYTLGMSLASPSTMVLTLNVFPAMRGLAASLQSFVQVLLFALVAAVIAPLAGGSALRLASFLAFASSCSLACLLMLAASMRLQASHAASPHSSDPINPSKQGEQA
ncbi:multidrug effflux MFS transporter [Noviherbaspirillum sp. UKPF54]|uniref:multidrug effflux MFS transporter n=1 Tax=Noviherbaspirillum sp. UKPF54 TaxID=2601898 RepID=UPI001FED42B2|nr:multidrug effflux MFS transporter [Noviherbaspirillum sp. UKPF54]